MDHTPALPPNGFRFRKNAREFFVTAAEWKAASGCVENAGYVGGAGRISGVNTRQNL
jgi:hypothetical protein